MGKILGRLFVTHIGAVDSETVIAVQNSTELDLQNDPQETSDVNDAGWKSFIDGLRGWAANINLEYDQANTDIDDLITNMIDPTQDTDVNCLIGQNAVIGDIAYQGTAKTSNIKVVSQIGTKVTMSLSLTGSGGLAQKTKTV